MLGISDFNKNQSNVQSYPSFEFGAKCFIALHGALVCFTLIYLLHIPSANVPHLHHAIIGRQSPRVRAVDFPDFAFRIQTLMQLHGQWVREVHFWYCGIRIFDEYVLSI